MPSIFELVSTDNDQSSNTISEPVQAIEKPQSIFQMQSLPNQKQTSTNEPTRVRSVLGAPIKGALKESREQIGKIPFLGSALEKLQGTPFVASDEEFNKSIEKHLPTKDEFLERGLERGGKMLPYAAINPTSILPNALKSIASGLVGEGIKEVGGGELAQSVGEILTFGLPSLGKKIVGKGAQQKELIEFARRNGLTEAQIAPAIQNQSLLTRLFAKVTPSRGSTERKLKESKTALGGIYNNLKESNVAQQNLAPTQVVSLLNEMKPILTDMPYAERTKIVRDFMDLVKDKFTGKGLINFYQDMNYQYKKGAKQVGRLLKPLEKALDNISPELGKDFQMTNQLFKQHAQLAGKLKPSIYSDIYGALGDAGKVVLGLATHNPLVIGEFLGEKVGRNFAKQMLLNPRFQNLSAQIRKSLNEGKWGIAKKLSDTLLQEVKEDDQDSVIKQ